MINQTHLWLISYSCKSCPLVQVNIRFIFCKFEKMTKSVKKFICERKFWLWWRIDFFLQTCNFYSSAKIFPQNGIYCGIKMEANYNYTKYYFPWDLYPLKILHCMYVTINVIIIAGLIRIIVSCSQTTSFIHHLL